MIHTPFEYSLCLRTQLIHLATVICIGYSITRLALPVDIHDHSKYSRILIASWPECLRYESLAAVARSSGCVTELTELGRGGCSGRGRVLRQERREGGRGAGRGREACDEHWQ